MVSRNRRAPKTVIDILIYDIYFELRGKLSVIHAIHNFSVWLRTGSIQADINRFRSHTGICIPTLRFSKIFTFINHNFKIYYGDIAVGYF